MVKVKVKNTTGIDVKIQEGNAGLFVTRALLRPKGSFTLDLHQNATYREYVLIRLPDNTPLEPVFSSDDVAEFCEIVIKEQEDSPKYCWEGILRGQKPAETPKQPKNAPAPQPNDVPVRQPNNGQVDPPNPSAGPVDNNPPPRVGWIQRLRNIF